MVEAVALISGRVKEECLGKLIFFGEYSLRKALVEYIEHYHGERNRQGKDNLLLFPDSKLINDRGKIKSRKRLNGIFKNCYIVPERKPLVFENHYKRDSLHSR